MNHYTLDFLLQRIEVMEKTIHELELERTDLKNQVTNLINNIEVCEAEIVTHQNGLGGYYTFMEKFNQSLNNY
jgi:chromosome segregation ATPase